MSEAHLSPGAGQGTEAGQELGGATSGAVELAIEGMHCESCVALVTEALEDEPGVSSASVDLGSATAVVRFDPAIVDMDGLRAAIAEVGYSAVPAG